MAAKLATLTILAVLAIGVATHASLRPAHAQEASAVQEPAVCVRGYIGADTVQTRLCTYPDGDILAMLNEPGVSGHPLLMLWMADGQLRLFTPMARQWLPQTWATAPGETMSVAYPSEPPCAASVEQRTMYRYRGHGWLVYASPDGRVSCRFAVSS
jgi:hypothetical protein